MSCLGRMLVVLAPVIFVVLGVFFYTTYKVVTRNKELSASAEAVNTFLGLVKPKYFLRWVFEHPPRSSSPLRASRSFIEKYDVIYQNIDGDELMTVKPRNWAE